MEIIIKKKIFDWHKKSFPNTHPDEQRMKVAERWCDFYNLPSSAEKEEKLEKLANVYIANTGYSRFLASDAAKVYTQIYAALKSISETKEELLKIVQTKCIE